MNYEHNKNSTRYAMRAIFCVFKKKRKKMLSFMLLCIFFREQFLSLKWKRLLRWVQLVYLHQQEHQPLWAIDWIKGLRPYRNQMLNWLLMQERWTLNGCNSHLNSKTQLESFGLTFHLLIQVRLDKCLKLLISVKNCCCLNFVLMLYCVFFF